MLPLIVVFLATFGVSEPEMGSSCEGALAFLKAQHLQIADIDSHDFNVRYTMVGMSPHRFYGVGPTIKVAFVECESTEVAPSPNQFLVENAFHSDNVQTPEATDSTCAEHLADLVGKDGMRIVDTARIPADDDSAAKHLFHLANNRSKNPKVATVLCGKGSQLPPLPEPTPLP
jgi:hypothetical protein